MRKASVVPKEDTVRFGRNILSFVLVVLFGCVCSIPQVVTFQDPDLEEAVRQALHKPAGDIMDTEMAGISELHLMGSTSGLLPLTGIEFCTGLQCLTCEFQVLGMTNLQVNARLDELSELTTLRSLTVTPAAMTIWLLALVVLLRHFRKPLFGCVQSC